MEDIKQHIISFATQLNAKIKGFNCFFPYVEQRRKDGGVYIANQGSGKYEAAFPKDNVGNYFYLRISKPIRYKHFASGIFDVTIPVRLVVWVKDTDVFALEYVMTRGLIALGVLNIGAMEFNANKIVEAEIKPVSKEVPDDITLISIDFELFIKTAYCGDCDLILPCTDVST